MIKRRWQFLFGALMACAAAITGYFANGLGNIFITGIFSYIAASLFLIGRPLPQGCLGRSLTLAVLAILLLWGGIGADRAETVFDGVLNAAVLPMLFLIVVYDVWQGEKWTLTGILRAVALWVCIAAALIWSFSVFAWLYPFFEPPFVYEGMRSFWADTLPLWKQIGLMSVLLLPGPVLLGISVRQNKSGRAGAFLWAVLAFIWAGVAFLVKII